MHLPSKIFFADCIRNSSLRLPQTCFLASSCALSLDSIWCRSASRRTRSACSSCRCCWERREGLSHGRTRCIQSSSPQKSPKEKQVSKSPTKSKFPDVERSTISYFHFLLLSSLLIDDLLSETAGVTDAENWAKLRLIICTIFWARTQTDYVSVIFPSSSDCAVCDACQSQQS